MVSLSQTCCDENKTFVFERVNHMDSFYTLRYVMNNSGIFSYKIFKGFDPVKHGKKSLTNKNSIILKFYRK